MPWSDFPENGNKYGVVLAEAYIMAFNPRPEGQGYLPENDLFSQNQQ